VRMRSRELRLPTFPIFYSKTVVRTRVPVTGA
jgi:hypothetical protein